MEEPEVYRDPMRDMALMQLGPYLSLSLPMTFFSQHGTLQMDWDSVQEKLRDIYALLVFGHEEEGGISLAKIMELAQAEEEDNGAG